MLGIGAYLLIGTLFAVPFLLRGVHKIDPAALEGSTGFRVLIFPGTVALWPLLLRRWLSGSGSPPEELGAHRQAELRSWCHGWMREALEDWKRDRDSPAFEADAAVLTGWLQQLDLDCVRSPEALADLQVGEREAWETFWGEVRSLASSGE